MTASGAGNAQHIGHSAIHLGHITVVSNGLAAHLGSSSILISAIKLDASGIIESLGSSEILMPAITMAASAIAFHNGMSDLLLPAVTVSGTAKAEHVGTSSLFLRCVVAAAAFSESRGSSIITLPKIKVHGGYNQRTGKRDNRGSGHNNTDSGTVGDEIKSGGLVEVSNDE